MKILKIEQDFKIPGTDIILEAGDSIQIQEAEVKESLVDLGSHIRQYVGQPIVSENPGNFGKRLGRDLNLAMSMTDELRAVADTYEFAEGVKIGILS